MGNQFETAEPVYFSVFTAPLHVVVLLTISNAYLIQLFSTAFSESSFSTVLQTLLNASPIENHAGTAETATT